MTPYEILERARAARFRPAENPEDLFGEFRSLAHHTFEGGELWSDWAPLISKMGEGDLERLAEYFEQHWKIKDHFQDPIEAIHHEFCYRAAAVYFELVRDEAEDGILYPGDNATYEVEFAFEDPASEEVIAAVKEKLGRPLPTHLERFARDHSAGIDSDGEQMWFFFGEDAYVPMTFAQFDLESCGVDDEYTDGASTREGRFALLSWTLEQLLASKKDTFELPRGRYEEIVAQYEGGAYPAGMLEDAIVIDFYFEGNHGDNVTFIPTHGPLANCIIIWSSYGHTMGTGGRVSCNLDFTFGDYIIELFSFFE